MHRQISESIRNLVAGFFGGAAFALVRDETGAAYKNPNTLIEKIKPSSLRRTLMYVSFLGFRKPCFWSFLLCHSGGENLRVH